jgi:hypothetical protein
MDKHRQEQVPGRRAQLRRLIRHESEDRGLYGRVGLAGEYQFRFAVDADPVVHRLAEELVGTLAEDFKPEEYHDEFREQMRALVRSKKASKTIVEHALLSPR